MMADKPIASAGHVFPFLLLLSLWTVSGGPIAAAEKPFAIYVMKIDGSQTRKLAQIADYTTHEAARWSHDGKQIVFAARNANSSASDIFVVNVDGSGLRKVGAGRHPDWSPDDKQIAFDLPSIEGTQVFVQNLDGQGSERVAQGSCPRWSPDGSQLAFAEGKLLHVMDLANGEQRALFDTPFETLYWGCCWSPDGKTLAISARPEPRARRHVTLVSAQGASNGVRTRLQNEASGQMGFSPDGKQLAFDNAYFIHIVDVEGNSAPRQLPGQKAQNLSPDWSPDGQWLVFTSNRD